MQSAHQSFYLPSSYTCCVMFILKFLESLYFENLSQYRNKEALLVWISMTVTLRNKSFYVFEILYISINLMGGISHFKFPI